MARNIYDLFNERRNGVDCLVEGFVPSDVEAFEDLNEAMEALDNIAMESTNEMIEMQAACYLEDLVLESMMYDDFEEDKIKSIMEGAEKEKKEGFVQKIKNLWQKIKDWFAAAFKTIANHFQSGETLVAKYRKQIPAAMHQSTAKIKIKSFKDPDEATKDMEYLIDRLKITGQSKEQILSAAGIADKKGITARVEDWFYNSKEAKEQPIKGLKPETVMKWASGKKIFIDGLKKQQKDTDGEFKSILSELQSGEGEKAAEKAANFQFGINIINGAFNAQIKCIRDLSNACTAIIRKALSGKYDPNGPTMDEAPDTADMKADKAFKEKAMKKGFSEKQAQQMSTRKLHEEWEILDEYEDFEW